MYSVDLAGVQMMRSIGRPWGIYRPQIHPKRPPIFIQRAPIRRMRAPEDAQKFATVLYWGDFQTNPLYGTHDFGRREPWANRTREPEAVFQSWMRFCLLKGVDMTGRQVISVSNNMQSLDQTLDKLGPEIREEIIGLYRKNFTAIYPRDQRSTDEIEALLPETGAPRPKIACGVDAAFLVKEHFDRPKRPHDFVHQRYFTYFFGRSKIAGTEKLVRDVEEATGLKGVPLEYWFTLNHWLARSQFSTMTTLIRHSEFLLSDTYHVCINALTLRRPVVGLGRPAADQDSTIGDFKKIQLFGMFGLSDTYITFDPDADGTDPGPEATSKITDLAKTFAKEGHRNDYFDLLTEKTEAYRTLLRNELTAT